MNVRISDINFHRGNQSSGSVTIARRADDIRDPRRNQPLVKTRAREIPIKEQLLDQTEEYIINWRSKIKHARHHGYLFVANSGKQLSISGLNKIFVTLRVKFPDLLPDNFFAHILRHSWNDRFSEVMDERNISEAVEIKARSYLMGWSETSNTAATYTKRHIRKKAIEASLELQNKILSGWKDK